MDWITLENPVAIWWLILVLASTINILFWFWTWRYLSYKKSNQDLSNNWIDKKNMIWLSAIYVFVCAFRSVFPRADVQRICLFDTWFSSVLVGRTLATIAELAFVTQWALVIRFLSVETKSSLAKKISFLIIPLIATAECFSWYAVITTHYLGNSVEESLWAISYALIAISLITLIPKLKPPLKLTAIFSVIGCFLYFSFMSLVDVPMYISRLIQDNHTQKKLLGFFEGLNDLNSRWVVTHNILDWRSEIPWQTLYFTFAVLISISLCYVPLEVEKIKKYLK